MIEKLHLLDQRPLTILHKLNEVIDVVNEHLKDKDKISQTELTHAITRKVDKGYGVDSEGDN